MEGEGEREREYLPGQHVVLKRSFSVFVLCLLKFVDDLKGFHLGHHRLLPFLVNSREIEGA